MKLQFLSDLKLLEEVEYLPCRDSMPDIITALSAQYIVNLENSVFSNFKRLLKRYVWDSTVPSNRVFDFLFADSYDGNDQNILMFRAFIKFFPFNISS